MSFAEQWLFIGTYTATGSKGIYVYRFNEQTGKLDSVSSIFVENPSYLALSSDGSYLYAVTENGGDKTGQVSAFTFDKASGKLRLLNTQPTNGDHPCYVAVNKSNKWVAVANYTGGNLSILAVNGDGSLQPAAQTIQHFGKGSIASRQEKPHVHMTIFSPKEEYLVANDLGTDEVNAYRFSPNEMVPLDSNASIKIKTTPGSGPRHLAFHSSKPLVYVLEELTGTVSVHYFTKNNVSLIQTISADTTSPLPDRGSADIHFSPDGKFLYASNRGSANYVTIYSVGAESGSLTKIASVPVQGEKPRNFTIDESGNYLLVANMGTNNVVVFKRNANTGLLSATGTQLSIPTPVCLKTLSILK
jgi:6-phosphogluconolactonase